MTIKISTRHGTVSLSTKTARWLEASGSDLRSSVEHDVERLRAGPEEFLAYLTDGAEPDDLVVIREYAAALYALVGASQHNGGQHDTNDA